MGKERKQGPSPVDTGGAGHVREKQHLYCASARERGAAARAPLSPHRGLPDPLPEEEGPSPGKEQRSSLPRQRLQPAE